MSGPRRPSSARLAVAAVGLVALALRLPALARPDVLVFDELFYAPDAADLLRWGTERGQPVHPPLGKWLIAGGIEALGFTPVGWRIASVLAGAALASVACWTAIRLARRTDAGVAAGLLVAFDGLVHTASRLALLDVFLALAAALALAGLVGAWTAQPDARRAARCWWVAAAAASAGVAVKWSALALLPLVLAVGWVLAHRLVAPGRPRRRARLARLVGVVVLPVLAVVAVTLPRQLGPDRTTPAAYLREQREVAEFHRDLRPRNRYAAPAWTWATQSHPVVMYRVERAGHEARVVAGANPVVWLLGLAGVLLALVGALRGRELPALLLGAVAALWVPWLLSPRESYSFYAVALVAPMVLCWVQAADRFRRRRLALWAPVWGAAVAFVALWPVWSAQPIDAGLARWLTAWPGWS